MGVGINAAFPNTSLFYISTLPNLSSYINREGTTYKVQQVSRGRYGKAQSGHRLFIRLSGVEYGERERTLKQRSRRIDSGLRCVILCRLPRSNRYEGQGKLQRRSSGVEGIPAIYDGDQEDSNEQPAAASEEIEAEHTRIRLSPELSSGHKSIFIFGFGYTSCAIARYLKNDWDEGLRELQQATHWLISVPPVADFGSDPPPDAVITVPQLEGHSINKMLREYCKLWCLVPFLPQDKAERVDRDRSAPSLISCAYNYAQMHLPVLTTHIQDLKKAVANGSVRWIGYLSSTGVYGDWQGNWVDEESEPRPVEQRALNRLAAEESWLKFGLNHGVPVHVFRLGGIYGPGRSAINTVLQKQKLSQRQQIREQRRFTSRIHVDDICQTILASMQNPDNGKIYNVVDDDPASRMEVLFYARDLLINQDANSHDHFSKRMIASPNIASGGSTLSNRAGEKRVSNKRIKLDLKVKLLYPTYKEGLKAILESIGNGRK